MDQIDLNAFNARQLHTTDTILLICERAGADVRVEREMIARAIERARVENRRNRKKPDPTPKKSIYKFNDKDMERAETTKTKIVMDSRIPCPDCQKGYLQVKTLEGVTYTACPQCYKSVEFK